ncbi:MAG: hypothetical protein ACE5NC_02245, partial [Anaerolineae bacterium]
MAYRLVWLLLVSVLAAVAACTSAPAAAPPPEPTEPPPAVATDTPEQVTPEPTSTPTTAPVAMQLPETPATASLGTDPQTTYKVQMGTLQPLGFDDSELPAAPGSVEAHWYTSGGRYVVAYVGLDLGESGPTCPGNSILTAQGFEFVSNAPTEEGACEGFTTLSADPLVGPRVCQEIVLYVTAIPSDEEGTLFGTLEALA